MSDFEYHPEGVRDSELAFFVEEEFQEFLRETEEDERDRADDRNDRLSPGVLARLARALRKAA